MKEKIIIENNVITIKMINSHEVLKKYIKYFLRNRNKLLRNNDNLEINLIDFEDKLIYNQFYELLKIILIGSKEEIYSKAYDLACDYLNKKGIKFKQREIFPIDSIFNWRQKIYFKSIIYTPKEKIMKGILFLS